MRGNFVELPWFEDRLWEWIEELPPKYQHIVKLRYGLAGNGLHTLEEIGQTLSITRERVRQLEGRSLLLLRRYSSQFPTENDCRQTPAIEPAEPTLLLPKLTPVPPKLTPVPPKPTLAPTGLRAKFRSDFMQRQIAKLTIRVRDHCYAKKYRALLGRYRFSEATNASKLFRRTDLWVGIGKNYWILFNSKTAVEQMGIEPSELRRILRRKFGESSR